MTAPGLAILALLLACKDAPAPSDSPAVTDSEEDSPTEDSGPLDEDGDGWPAGRGDCDDHDPNVHAWATETADGVDQDCDGLVDEGTEVYDDDGDGFSEVDGDCNDADPTFLPGGEDLFPCDGIDQSCMGLVEPCDSLDEAHATIAHAFGYALLGGVDMTGDGQADVVTATGSLRIWEIPQDGGQYEPGDHVALLYSSNYTGSDMLAALGDTDGDGFVEIVQGNLSSGSVARVNILSAPLVGDLLASDVAVAMFLGDDASRFGDHIDAGFDASGDGVADILIGAPYEGESIGSIYLVSGDVRAEVSAEDVALAHIYGEAERDYVGQGLRFSGDNNGDGVADVLVGRWGASDGPTRVSWFAGPLSGSLSTTDGDVVLEDTTRFLSTTAFASPGDLDGDGLQDLTLRTSDGYCISRLHVFTSVPSAGLDGAVARLDGEDYCAEDGYYDDGFGEHVLMADVNGDGFDDLVVGAVNSRLGGIWIEPRSGYYYYSGAVAVFIGPFSGVRGLWEAERIWAGEYPGAELGRDLASAGDFDGDGREDFLMAAPYSGEPSDDWWGSDTMDGAAYLMLGSADW